MPIPERLFYGLRLSFLAKMPLMLLFGFFVVWQLIAAFAIVYYWSEFPSPNKPLSLLGTLAGAAFSFLIVITTFNRLDPKLQSDGLAPRICALAGAFLSLLLIVMPSTAWPAGIQTLAIVVTILGTGLSFWVLRWLGRSFSIMAEARALVTAGPYSLVRHPLYVTETIGLLGALVLHLSWVTVLLVVVQLAFQWRRVLYEEAVLRRAFPEYDDYARRVPRFIPRLGSLRRAFSGA